MSKKIYLGVVLIALLVLTSCLNETSLQSKIVMEIDSLLLKNKGFNGVVVIEHKGKEIYSKALGVSDLEKQTPLKATDKFVIGSVSKQITAVMVLQEFEKDKLKLNDPIKKFLPEVTKSWADSVTIHHLLTHTHGVINIDKPLAFEPGSKFSYSQLGYQLLANILEKVTGSSFMDISMSFFKENGLHNTFHPKSKKYKLVKGYIEKDDKSLEYEENSLGNYVPAGSFISTAQDLNLWNNLLYKGKLLKQETLNLMSTRYATRQHPIFGEIEYGYGLLFINGEENIEIGAFGYAPAFVSTCYYYPKSEISVIVLENIARNLGDFKKTFKVHTGIMRSIKSISEKIKKQQEPNI